MDYINKVELQGIIGKVDESQIDKDKTIYNFSLCTASTYGMLCDTVWHHIRVIDKNLIGILEKGKWAHVIGLIKRTCYMDANGEERSSIVISADKVEVK